MKPSGNTLYVSDLDSTLLDASSQIPMEAAAMLNQAIDRGALFTVATARTPATVNTLLADINMRLPAIVMTGAALWDFDSQMFTDPQFIPEKEAIRIMEVFRKHSLPHFIYTLADNVINLYHVGDMSDLDQEFVEARTKTSVKRLVIGKDGMPAQTPTNNKKMLLFYTMRPTAHVEAVWYELRNETECTPVFYHDIFGPETGILEVFRQGCNKATAIRRMATRTKAKRIVAFGDNINDIPMLREADIAVAVANASPEVLREADIIIGANTECAVAKWILSDIENNDPK